MADEYLHHDIILDINEFEIKLPKQRMLHKNDNRKAILQQLLEKSELFSNYFQSQMIDNTQIMLPINNSKTHTVQFGKCEINLPQKIKVNNHSTQKFNRKVMVLSKGKHKEKGEQHKVRNSVENQRQQILKNMENLKTKTKNMQFQLRNALKSERGAVTTEVPDYRQMEVIALINKDRKFSQLSHNICQNEPLKSEKAVNSRLIDELCTDEQLIEQERRMAKKGAEERSDSQKHDADEKTNKSQFPSGSNLIQKSRIFSAKLERRQPTPQNFGKMDRSRLNSKGSVGQLRSNENDSQLLTDRRAKQEILYQHSQQQRELNSKSEHQKDIQLHSTSLSTESRRNPHQFNQKNRSSTFKVKKYQSLLGKNYQQKLEEEKRAKINSRRQVHKIYNRAFVPPPKVSAVSFCVYEMAGQQLETHQNCPTPSNRTACSNRLIGDFKSQGKVCGKILVTQNGKNSQEVASLTKIMTCIVVLEISQHLKINLNEETVEIGKFESSIGGTSARIASGEIYTVKDLLYGLMLPSGNDASLALGVWGGRQLIENESKDLQNCSEVTNDRSCASSPVSRKVVKRQAIQRFLEEMNKKAGQLNMTKTNYANTHGLINSQNKSSAIDVAFLSEYAMQNPQFRQIVSTKFHTARVKYRQLKSLSNTEQSSFSPAVLKEKEVTWENTHRLLHRKSNEYIGIKTGVTTAAGPCLSSCVVHRESGRQFIIVVLGCSNMLGRFKETEVLKKWLYKQENLKASTGNKRKFKNRSCSIGSRGNKVASSEKADESSNSQDDDLEGEVEADELD